MTPLQPIQLKDLPEFVPCEGYHGKLIHTDVMTVAHWTILANHELPTHSHPHEQIVNVMEGEFELTVNGVAHHLMPGDVFVIPGNVPHSGISLTDSRLIDVWHPPRTDYQK